MSSQIVETSQVCRATVVMINKVEPCHVEPCRPAIGSCNLFCAQLAASVDLSILVLYGHISAVRRQCAQHYSGSVVAKILNIHWYHTEGYCNNPNGMSLPNLSFFTIWSVVEKRQSCGRMRWKVVSYAIYDHICLFHWQTLSKPAMTLWHE